MEVLIGKVIPDKNQPRRYFAADKMFTLKESIKKHGIVSPIIVQDMGDGTYLIEDGERRYRAAKELHLKQVPIIVRKKTSDVDRLINQFTIQEQHEAWTPMEKAQALISLSEALGMTLPEVCRQLGLGKVDASRYVAFSTMSDKEAYIRSEIPLDYALEINHIKRVAKRITEDELGKEFTPMDEKKLEARVIVSIRNGVITSRKDASHLRDAFTKNPKVIEKYLKNDSVTPTALYLETGAQGARALRNTVYNASYIFSHGEKFLKLRDVKVSAEQLATLKRGQDTLRKIIDLVE